MLRRGATLVLERPRSWGLPVLGALVTLVVAAIVAVVGLALSPDEHHSAAAPQASAHEQALQARHPKASTASAPQPILAVSARVRPIAGEQRDPEARLSAPAPPSVRHADATAPQTVAMVAPGAPTDAQVRAELRSEQAALRSERSAAPTSSGALAALIASNGTVPAPSAVPAVIDQIVAGANAITDFPYVYGGGHASFIDNAYDCSGSVSYALAAGGLLSVPETSGQLERWGAPGPGRWLTIYANAGHVYMFVGGLRYDTAGRTGVFSTRWQVGADPVGGPANTGFVARHWPGL